MFAGAADGCPSLGGTIGKIKGNKLKRKLLVKGIAIPVACGTDSNVAVALTIKSKVAKALKIPVKKKAKTVVVGAAKGRCTAGKKSAVKLKLAKAFRKKLLKSRKTVAASLTVTFSLTGRITMSASRSVKLN
ncbi:MAG: hypothetical protein WAP35_09390 [Solirubrobacterales bacterium]